MKATSPAALALAIVPVISVMACSKKSADAPLSCEQVQQHAESCSQQTLEIVKAAYAAPVAGSVRVDAEQQYKMFESRFRSKLASRQVQKQCEKFQRAGHEAHDERMHRMKACHAKQACDEFARCMLELE